MNATTEIADEIAQSVDIEDPRQDDLELLEDFDRNKAKHTGAYSVEFIHEKVIIAGAYHKDIACIMKLDISHVVPEFIAESVQEELIDIPISTDELDAVLKMPIGSALQMIHS